MRLRTSAVLAVVLIGGMFAYPAALHAFLFPVLRDPIPAYQRILLEVDMFLLRWRFILALPILLVLFGLPGVTKISQKGT
jgi:hypothetical protein